MLNKFSLPNLPFFSFDYTAYSTVWNCERLHSCYIAGFLWKRTGWRHTLTIHVFVSARIVVKHTTEKTTYFFGSAEKHYPRATVYRRPRRPAAADRLAASSYTLLAHTVHWSQQHAWFCSESFTRNQKALAAVVATAGELFPGCSFRRCKTTAAWWICCPW